MHPYNRRQVRNNRETFVIIVMAYYSLNLLLMKKNSYIMFAGLLAFLLSCPLLLLAQRDSQNESELRRALSAKQGGLAMGSLLNMPVGSLSNTASPLLNTVEAPLRKPFVAPILKVPSDAVLWGNAIH